MPVVTCPICGRAMAGPIAEWPRLPFCGDQCKLIDLGRWLDGTYVNALPEKEPQEGTDPEDIS